MPNEPFLDPPIQDTLDQEIGAFILLKATDHLDTLFALVAGKE